MLHMLLLTLVCVVWHLWHVICVWVLSGCVMGVCWCGKGLYVFEGPWGNANMKFGGNGSGEV